jgi:hypothetical protein
MLNGHIWNWVVGFASSLILGLLGIIGWVIRKHVDDDRDRHIRTEKAVEEIRRLLLEELIRRRK